LWLLCRKEAAMMAQFKTDLASLDGIVVPNCSEDLTTRRVIVTEWIDGEKLSESRAEDVRELCTTLLNAYLVQLLDTGLLHADPHPGNLIRTPEGKICILDYGTTRAYPSVSMI
jgi:aarF domain-containing kinase